MCIVLNSMRDDDFLCVLTSLYCNFLTLACVSLELLTDVGSSAELGKYDRFNRPAWKIG